jgi:uncharacterized protein YdbL (DUF1318 family)
MMRLIFTILAVAAISMGCAKVQVMAPKEPIKVDIAMRLDIYQHVEKDINAIEDMVSGGQPMNKPQSFLDGFVGVAYAQEDSLSPQVQEAVLSRKARYNDLISAEVSGRIGENKLGLVELRGSGGDEVSLASLVSAENKDRLVIYQSIAQKNGISLNEVQVMYAKKLQDGAQAGTLIQQSSGAWKIK